jgi:DNA oxidative demethylase
MLHTLYTLGYAKLSGLEELGVVLERHNAILVDIRHNPFSRKPGFNQAELQKYFGSSYIHLPELGNTSYKQGQVNLANNTTGYFKLLALLEKANTLIMCGCADYRQCHRHYIAKLFWDVPVKHLEADMLFTEKPKLTNFFVEGFYLIRDYLSYTEQEAMLQTAREIAEHSYMLTPVMPTGTAFRVKVTNCGKYGWYSDTEKGYHYTPVHPRTSKAWQAIPEQWAQMAIDLASLPEVDYPAFKPENCLLNYYNANGSLGLHTDDTELNKFAPIISVSLGCAAEFMIGGLKRTDPTKTLTLFSGDVMIMAGTARHCYHGIKNIHSNTSNLIPEGRLNITFRQV